MDNDKKNQKLRRKMESRSRADYEDPLLTREDKRGKGLNTEKVRQRLIYRFEMYVPK